MTTPPKAHISVAGDWARDGFSCDLWIDPPGQRWENFVHASDERVIVLEGHIEMEIAGEVKYPEVGSLVRIPAGARHSVRNIGRGTARWLYGYGRENRHTARDSDP